MCQLSRLVIEHEWRTDHGRADTVHELYVDDGELTLGTTAAPIRGSRPPWHRIRHVCGNMRFVADGPNAAEGTTLLTVFHGREAGNMVEKPGMETTLPWRSRL